MSGMTVSPGRAVQVLSLIDDEENPGGREARLLKLDTQVLRDITGKVDKDGHPLAAIVIAGPERQGKSFMLTYFVRYLQALERSNDGVVGDWMDKSNPEISMKDRGFNFENGLERTTEGIWMWSRPFIIPDPASPDKKIAVLLMDTEGCYGSSLTNQEQAALVGLSLLTSSVFIYNETTRINDSTLASVGKFMQYGQLASQTFQGKMFHQIMFLIRDWNFPNIYEYGAAGGQGFIREFFREKPRMTKEAVEYRNAIKKHFEDCSAYLMPHPGQAVLSDKFAGSVAEMTPEFCYHLENCVTNLIADVGPKMLGANFVTGSSFTNLFQAYVKAFNATDMPSPASILKATLFIAFDTEIRSLAATYESSLRIRLTDADNSGHLVTSEQLAQWGRNIAGSIMSTFEQKEHRCSKEDKIFYIERLKVEIDRIQKKISEENEASRNKFIQRSAAAACTVFESFLKKHVGSDGQYWKRPEFDAKVNPTQEQCLEDFMKACSSVPSEHIQPMVTDARDKMHKATEALWTQLAARTTEAEDKAYEIMRDILDEYISNMELLMADDVQPEVTLERFHNKEANIAHVGFKRRIETEFKDAKFIMESTDKFNMCLQAEYEKLKEGNASELNQIRGQLDAEIANAVALFKQESTQGIVTADQSILKGNYGDVLELALEAFEDIAIPNSRFYKEYIRKLRAALTNALDEAVASVVKSVEAKQLQCKQFAQNACQDFNEKLSSWIQATGTVSLGAFHDRSHELMQNEMSKCEADMRTVMPEYSSYLKEAQELMEQKREEFATVNTKKVQEIENFALEQIQTIKYFYEASLHKSVDQCKDLADLKKLDQEIGRKLLSQFHSNLESWKALSFYDTSEAACKKEMAECFTEKQHQFLHKTEVFNKLRTQRIPQCGKDLTVRIEERIRRNPFISEADVDVILQQEWPEVKHSLIREIKSENSLTSTEFLGLVGEVGNQLEETKKEVKQKLRMERDQADEKAESVYQNVLDFAMTELSRVVELLLDGSRKDMEEEFQTLKSQVDSKFEDEWPYEPCSKKDSSKLKIHSKLDKKLDNARREVLKKLSEDSKYVAENLDSVLSSFGSRAMEILDEDKFTFIENLEDQLKEEMDLRIQEFQKLLSSNQLEHFKYNKEIMRKFKEKKRHILQINTKKLEKIGLVFNLQHKALEVLAQKIDDYCGGISIVSQADFNAQWEKLKNAVILELEIELMRSNKMPPSVALDITDKLKHLLGSSEQPWQKQFKVNEANRRKIVESMEKFVSEFQERIKEIERGAKNAQRKLQSKKGSALADFRLSFVCPAEEERSKLLKELEPKLDKVIEDWERGQPMMTNEALASYNDIWLANDPEIAIKRIGNNFQNNNGQQESMEGSRTASAKTSSYSHDRLDRARLRLINELRTTTPLGIRPMSADATSRMMQDFDKGVKMYRLRDHPYHDVCRAKLEQELREICENRVEIEISAPSQNENILKKTRLAPADLNDVKEVTLRAYKSSMDKHFTSPTYFQSQRLTEFHTESCNEARDQIRHKLDEEDAKELQSMLDDAYMQYESKNNMNTPTSRAIGIDLGTTYSCVGVYINNRVEIIPNERWDMTTPSFVSFGAGGSTQPVCGYAAKEQAHLHPEGTIYEVKRLIGRSMEDPDVAEDLKKWPFKVVNERGAAKVLVGERTYLPEEISAMLLKKLKHDTEEYLNDKVKYAVITVPAYFSEAQRNATKNAGKEAGLEVLRIINEPTAAAIAYYNLSWARPQRVVRGLVYDFGERTFDVAVFEANKGQIAIKAIGGDSHLGGVDFDNAMMNHCIRNFKQTEGKDLETGRDMAAINRTKMRIKGMCEKSKKNLSTAPEATVFLECIYGSTPLNVKIKRAEFEQMIDIYIKKSIECVKKTLDDAKLRKEDIEEILLIGGSTRIPKIRMALSLFFGRAVNFDINPDEVVAFGAAYEAAVLNGARAQREGDIRLPALAPRMSH